jgi:hypothetical protein
MLIHPSFVRPIKTLQQLFIISFSNAAQHQYRLTAARENPPERRVNDEATSSSFQGATTTIHQSILIFSSSGHESVVEMRLCRWPEQIFFFCGSFNHQSRIWEREGINHVLNQHHHQRARNTFCRNPPIMLPFTGKPKSDCIFVADRQRVSARSTSPIRGI